MESPLKHISPQSAVVDHPVWREITPEITPSDFNQPFEMDVGFLRWLYKSVRIPAGVPMWFTSDARDPEGDVGAKSSAHKKRPCRAVDFQVRKTWHGMPGSEQMARIIFAAVLGGCVRVGLYQSQSGLGDIGHIDCETHPDNPSPRLWLKWKI